MPDLLYQIQGRLNSGELRKNLTPLFCETLKWGRPDRQQRALAVGAPINRTIKAVPVAQLGGLPVFRVDWDSPRLPNVAQRRAVHRALAPTNMEHLLCYITNDSKQLAFVWARQRAGGRTELRTLPYEVASPARTTIERLNELAFTIEELGLFGEPAITKLTDKLNAAFDVEAVTKGFFQEYRDLFEQAEGKIKGITGDDKRIFTQKLFNRLLFTRFLERKGWLTFQGKREYLRALWDGYYTKAKEGDNFYRDRLQHLFFSGLNTPHEVNLVEINRGGFLVELIGQVPYLNGGLFEEDEMDRKAGINVPDKAIEPILTDLFYRFNFTVTETTPLDIEVAVDPEMLGKIFEELVTGRHETGSYYTPKEIVSFMCGESLKHYLTAVCPGESTDAVDLFVYQRDPSKFHRPEGVLEALRQIKVCDPACGSGAYLLGMLHELLGLRHALFASYQMDAHTVYDRKLEIIENNLYGVDKDPFAVNIARLRLWLSLIVDYEGGGPLPLPNLDFKIEVGDSLASPDPQGVLQKGFRDELVIDFEQKKAIFMQTHQYGEKQTIRKEIIQLRQQIADWTGKEASKREFDWKVDFAEVFTSSGFDIVIANPPYIRMELFKDEKPTLRTNFPAVHADRADYYVYFYARAQELLKHQGIGCFISSDKWLRSGYGENLRQFLLDSQQFQLIVDFGELPVFQAASTFPAVFIWQKAPRGNTPTLWATVQNLDRCYDEGIREHILSIAKIVPSSRFGKGKPRLATTGAADRLAKMTRAGTPLGDIAPAEIYSGIKTGYNAAFWIDRPTKDALVASDPRSVEVIKKLARGDDIRKWYLRDSNLYIIYTPPSINIDQYPSVKRHLRRFQSNLEARAISQPWWELQQAQNKPGVWANPKIVWPDICKESRFTLDTSGTYVDMKGFVLPSADLYLVGVLNTQVVWWFLQQTCAVLGDPYSGGRLQLKRQYVECIPIPDPSKAERNALEKQISESRALHVERRKRVEEFLRDIGTPPAEASSRNVLEQPWTLKPNEFTKRAKSASLRIFTAARDETAALTEQIARVEREIDDRVAALYGL